MPPTTYLQPGSSDTQAVKKLQDYLVNKNYMTQDQVNTGYGIYGPHTKAGVTAMQNALGVDNTGGAGYYGPKTLKAIQSSPSATENVVPNVTKQTPTVAQTGTQEITAPAQPSSTLKDFNNAIVNKNYGALKKMGATVPANQGYTQELTSALGGTQTAPVINPITNPTVNDTMPATDKSYVAKLQKQITDANTALQVAGTKLSTAKSDAYNTAYASSGIDKIKTQISTIDTQIASDRQKRDTAIAAVTNNPQLSAALMTGRAAKIANAENARINNLINERNGLAGTYNTGLSEVHNKANNATTDAMDAYNAARNLVSSTMKQAVSYRTALIDSLKQGATKAYRNKTLKIGLMNARSAAERARKYGTLQGKATQWKLATSPLTGEALYWYNSAGETKPLSSKDRTNLVPPTAHTAVVNTTPKIVTPSNTGGIFNSIKNGIFKIFGGK